jgi:hypothetical protein
VEMPAPAPAVRLAAAPALEAAAEAHESSVAPGGAAVPEQAAPEQLAATPETAAEEPRPAPAATAAPHGLHVESPEARILRLREALRAHEASASGWGRPFLARLRRLWRTSRSSG